MKDQVNSAVPNTASPSSEVHAGFESVTLTDGSTPDLRQMIIALGEKTPTMQLPKIGKWYSEVSMQDDWGTPSHLPPASVPVNGDLVQCAADGEFYAEGSDEPSWLDCDYLVEQV